MELSGLRGLLSPVEQGFGWEKSGLPLAKNKKSFFFKKVKEGMLKQYLP